MIHIIELSMPFHLGIVNCYLIEKDAKFLLIDTGSSNSRRQLELELDRAGCWPGNLKLIILTHGDFDHTGNAAFLRHKYGVRVAMHQADTPMAEQGDMFAGRNRPNFLIRKVLPALSGFGRSERFSPDLFIGEGYELSAHGFDARVYSIPGHSLGSIGVLVKSGEFFCGDLFENIKKPALGSIMDNQVKAKSSAARLKKLKVTTVFPGHGKPFLIKDFFQAAME